MVRFVRPIINQVLRRQKTRIQSIVTDQYGQIAGGIAGIAISAFAGDYYGAFSGISSGIRDEFPNRRDPPIGYYDPTGDGLIGPSNGSFHQTLQANNPQYGRNRYKKRRNFSFCSCKRYSRKQPRSRRRKYGKSRIPRNMGYR